MASVVRHLEGSEQTFHRWRNQYGGMKADDDASDCVNSSGRTLS